MIPDLFREGQLPVNVNNDGFLIKNQKEGYIWSDAGMTDRREVHR